MPRVGRDNCKRLEDFCAVGAADLFNMGGQVFGPVEAVYAETARYSEGSDADEEAFVSLRHVSGTRSRLMMSGMAALSAPRFHVLGSKGAYSKWGLDGQEAALAGGATPTDEDYGLEPESTWGTVGVPGDTQKLPSERGAYGEFYRLLAESLTVGAPLPVDPADSVEVLRIIERAHAVAALQPHQI